MFFKTARHRTLFYSAKIDRISDRNRQRLIYYLCYYCHIEYLNYMISTLIINIANVVCKKKRQTINNINPHTPYINYETEMQINCTLYF